MTLADFFLAVNRAGITLTNVSGQLQLRGPTDAISPEIRAGAAQHKETILAMMPPAAEPAETGVIGAPASKSGDRSQLVAALRAEEAARLQTSVAARRHDHDWQ